MSGVRRRARQAGASLSMGAAVGVGATGWWLGRHWVSLRRAIAARPAGNAIVVFGCSVLDDGPSSELRARLDHALRLWQDGCAPLLVVSGGVDRGIDEVTVMRRYLEQAGVPPEAIVDGRPGDNTRATVSTMADLALGPYVGVSSAYHSRRIESECARQGIDVVMSAPATTPETARPRTHAVRFLTDAVGTLWYAVPPAVTQRVDVGWLRHEIPQFLTGRERPPRLSGPPDEDRPSEAGAAPPLHVAPGHPYSPLPSLRDVDRAVRTAAAADESIPGLDMRVADQMALLESWVEAYDDLDFPDEPGSGRFYYANNWFTYADAVGYALMLRDLRPRRVVEVGCGFSSALALDVAERFLPQAPAFTFIDPDPVRLREVTRPGDLTGRLLARPVQDVPVERFRELAADDILFVDSSHVLKAGSDVQYLLDHVLPALAPGVRIHFHDVFAAFEYPDTWLRQGVALNEAYAVRALLSGGDRYRVVLSVPHLARHHRAWLAEHMPLMLAGDFPTGGIWLEKT